MADAPNTMRRDVISAYCAAGARILSWVVVSAVVYRRLGAGAFALVAFVKGTIGILNYASVGLAPAMIRLLSEARAARPAIPINDPPRGQILEYANLQNPSERIDPVHQVYVNGIAWSAITCIFGLFLLAGYFYWIQTSIKMWDYLAREGDSFVLIFGIGVLIRLLSDAPSAVLQTSGRIALDNALVISAEVLWAFIAVSALLNTELRGHIRLGPTLGLSYALTSLGLLIARSHAARRSLPRSDVTRFKLLNPTILLRLFRFGSLTTAAQLADYLYAPTDFLLIAFLLSPIETATYAPAVQIDAGLLVLVTGLASVLLPKAAMAHTAGDHSKLHRYYLRGTFGSGIILLLAAVAVWLTSLLIFKLWFNDPMPATQAILPLILIHTVIGGSSAVGRSILLGMGKVKQFTVAVLIAGASNVILSFVFVQYLHLGLRGIVLGTIVAVVGRCAIWMPWYVLRSLRGLVPSPGTPAAAEIAGWKG